MSGIERAQQWRSEGKKVCYLEDPDSCTPGTAQHSQCWMIYPAPWYDLVLDLLSETEDLVDALDLARQELRAEEMHEAGDGCSVCDHLKLETLLADNEKLDEDLVLAQSQTARLRYLMDQARVILGET